MKLYIDSADLTELANLKNSPFVDGVTTNPSLIASGMGKNEVSDVEYFDYLQKIRKLSPGELFIQLASTEKDSVVYEISRIKELIRWPVVIKVPAVPDGYYAIAKSSKEGFVSAATAVYSSGQACLALAAGAKYVIPYYSRLKKIGDALETIKEILNVTGPERLLVASIKSEKDFSVLLREGIINFTVPYSLFHSMGINENTEKAVAGFSSKLKVNWSRKKK